MKTKAWLLLPLVVLLLAGCVVTSINPFHDPADRVTDPDLVGDWYQKKEDGSKDKDLWRFAEAQDKGYRLTIKTDKGEPEYDAFQFKLGSYRFLDCVDRARPENGVPVHYLLRVYQTKPTLKLAFMPIDWMEKKLKEDPKLLRHTWVQPPLGETNSKPALVLTAETAELKKFLLEHADDKGAFTDPVEMVHP